MNPNINMQSFSNIDPKRFDQKIKNQIVNQNIYHSGYGIYKMCPIAVSIKIPYKASYNPGNIDFICKVLVHNRHPIDVAYTLSDHGLNSLTSRKSIPVIVYPLGKDFLGSNFESREGIYDENIILRTNYPYVIKKQMELFPLKDDKPYCVVYTNPITVIRDTNYNPSSIENVFKVGIITMCYDRKNKLLKKKSSDAQMLSSNDFLNFQICIENSFQTAICGLHEVLIIPFFCEEFGIPVEDQIIVLNHSIIKYGHKFKGIIICVPPYENTNIFEHFDREIIKPNDIVKNIDMKYQAEEMTKRIGNDDSDIIKKRTKNKKLK